MNKISENQLHVSLSIQHDVLELISNNTSLKNTDENTVADIFSTPGEFSDSIFLIVEADARRNNTESVAKYSKKIKGEGVSSRCHQCYERGVG